jgi:hypothetical protein
MMYELSKRMYELKYSVITQYSQAEFSQFKNQWYTFF